MERISHHQYRWALEGNRLLTVSCDDACAKLVDDLFKDAERYRQSAWAADGDTLDQARREFAAELRLIQVNAELAEIRRRNRAREQYGQERAVAQVLAFAA